MLVREAKKNIDKAKNTKSEPWEISRIIDNFEEEAENKLKEIYRKEIQKHADDDVEYDEVSKLQVEVLGQLIDYIDEFKADIGEVI